MVVLVVLVVLEELMVLGQLAVLMAAAVVLAQQAALVRLSLQPPVLALFVLSIPVLAVHSHLLVQEICNESLY